jgi:hypothetical protein
MEKKPKKTTLLIQITNKVCSDCEFLLEFQF